MMASVFNRPASLLCRCSPNVVHRRNAAFLRPKGKQCQRTRVSVSSEHSEASPSSSLLWTALTLASATTSSFLSAAAAEVSSEAVVEATSAVTYNNADGGDFIKNVAGAAYVLLVGWFLWRVLRRRAKRAREEVSRRFIVCIYVPGRHAS